MAELQNKVHGLYDLIGERELFVNTNDDIFLGHEEVHAGHANQFKYRLLQENGKAYASPMLFAALTSILNHGTMLMTGAHGTGKTTGAYLAGHFFTGMPYDEIQEATIHGHPQQSEEKMIARYHTGSLLKGEEVVLWRKFVTSRVKVVNELNRLGPDLLNILMDFIDTGKATYGEEVKQAEPGPLFATVNYTDSGTYDVPPPLLDRLDVAVVITSPQPWDLETIANRSDEKLNGGMKNLLRIPQKYRLTKDDREVIRKEISAISEEEGLSAYRNFIFSTIRFSEAASPAIERMTKGNAWHSTNTLDGHFTGDHPSLYTENELSVRALKSLQRYSKALAWLTGSDTLTKEHLNIVFPYIAWHRLIPSDRASGEWPHTGNDRLHFCSELIKKIDTEWTSIQSQQEINTYAVALDQLTNSDNNSDQRRMIAKNAITTICEWDNPFALVLAKQIESVYNRGE